MGGDDHRLNNWLDPARGGARASCRSGNVLCQPCRPQRGSEGAAPARPDDQISSGGGLSQWQPTFRSSPPAGQSNIKSSPMPAVALRAIDQLRLGNVANPRRQRSPGLADDRRRHVSQLHSAVWLNEDQCQYRRRVPDRFSVADAATAPGRILVRGAAILSRPRQCQKVLCSISSLMASWRMLPTS